ncbi:hypothetical protein AZL_020520 [Azospirillum sp. B510]|uniref:hypothetical protein n=1 Tax=Azospirillum sp. (strain B510) TaxID=137722 RepID=UPI0001C4C2EB|nr:hypothetical protein [Azospirillum sp. B510]BAI71461.1 hypothetical protein AZL_008230 [Azospirillum sp. B510]BAI72690.1 hypothetical protein AZL_020520 [Azospirillum sp. B510]
MPAANFAAALPETEAADLSYLRDSLSQIAAAQGLRPVVSDDWQALEALNARHRDSWFELLPKPSAVPCFWVGLTTAEDEVVAVQASILLDCRARPYAARLTDLTAFYDAGNAPPDAYCFAASPEARETRGAVAMMSSGWVHPDWRGGHRDLFHMSGRINRLEAVDRWQPDYLAALVETNVSRIWTERAVGERHLDRHPTIMFHQPGEGRITLHLMRFRPAAVISDLARRASSPPTEWPGDARSASRSAHG